MTVPEAREAIEGYVQHGHDPGSFLRAVIANDLALTLAKATPESLAWLPGIVEVVHREQSEGVGRRRQLESLDWQARKPG